MRSLYLLSLILLFASCGSSNIVDTESASPPKFSIIYVIHSDANYLYHTAEGKALQANDQVLAEAKKVAQQATSAEVFIFHQKSEQKILWLFPKKDRQFLYYRNGKKVAEHDYSPQSENESFKAESALYQQFSKLESTSDPNRIFLYFGHEIPETQNGVYHYSRPDAVFDTNIFAEGVQSFLPAEDLTFKLTVLSTCNNGTPTMVRALSPFTDYVLASPQNLHLSHIDSQYLPSLLEQKPESMKETANALAAKTYERLSGFLQTAITLSVYDTNQTSEYLPAMTRRYSQYLKTLSGQELLDVNNDCATLPFFDRATINGGVNSWYAPPKFGSKEKQGTTYSGWGCK